MINRVVRNLFLGLAVTFYIPICLSVSVSSMNSWLTAMQGESDNPVCGCEDASCCCGAPCCAPKDDPIASIQFAWKASCTCGGGQTADGTILADPHTIVQCASASFWLPALAQNSSYVRNWASLLPAVPEQVPKTFLFS
jgi:hypothetical protein